MLKNVGELPIVGLTEELLDAVVGELVAAFRGGHAPSRAWVMKQLKAKHPELIHPRVEYTVAQMLYSLVNKGTLERRGSFYFPGPQYREAEPKGEL